MSISQSIWMSISQPIQISPVSLDNPVHLAIVKGSHIIQHNYFVLDNGLCLETIDYLRWEMWEDVRDVIVAMSTLWLVTKAIEILLSIPFVVHLLVFVSTCCECLLITLHVQHIVMFNCSIIVCLLFILFALCYCIYFLGLVAIEASGWSRCWGLGCHSFIVAWMICCQEECIFYYAFCCNCVLILSLFFLSFCVFRNKSIRFSIWNHLLLPDLFSKIFCKYLWN